MLTHHGPNIHTGLSSHQVCSVLPAVLRSDPKLFASKGSGSFIKLLIQVWIGTQTSSSGNSRQECLLVCLLKECGCKSVHGCGIRRKRRSRTRIWRNHFGSATMEMQFSVSFLISFFAHRLRRGLFSNNRSMPQYYLPTGTYCHIPALSVQIWIWYWAPFPEVTTFVNSAPEQEARAGPWSCWGTWTAIWGNSPTMPASLLPSIPAQRCRKLLLFWSLRFCTSLTLCRPMTQVFLLVFCYCWI